MEQEEKRQEVRTLVLAAGRGTRMRSKRPKVLHELCGRTMLGYAEKLAAHMGDAPPLVVVGKNAEAVRAAPRSRVVEFVLQAEPRGTGHAVMMAQEALQDFEGEILILYGDTPLLRAETLDRMRALKLERRAELVVLTADGGGPGRIVRDSEGRIARIVEEQDANSEELAIRERNSGVYLIDSNLLWPALASLEDNNSQGELYLTDVVTYAVEGGRKVEGLLMDDADEGRGINTRNELAQASRILRQRINREWMDRGVTLVDPETTYIDVMVSIGQDSVIEPGCSLLGQTQIGRDVHIKAGSYIEDSRLDDGVVFGPYSHLRPHSHLKEGVSIGNFVEVKNSVLGPGSKSAHLTYIGDADVGSDVNFGCGSVVVNYDGYQKHRSQVGDGAFVGCNVNLISPVEIEPRAFLAAGSTITKRVPQDALAVARARQQNLEGWVARKEGRARPDGQGGSSESDPIDEGARSHSKTIGGAGSDQQATKKMAAGRVTEAKSRAESDGRAKGKNSP